MLCKSFKNGLFCNKLIIIKGLICFVVEIHTMMLRIVDVVIRRPN